MTVKSEQTWAGLFVTLDATGALASGTPSGVLYVDGVANAAPVTITGSNPYKYSVTLPVLTAGQRVDMYITATIATIATAAVVASEQADTSLLSDGVAVASIATDAITAAAIKADAITEIQNGLATPTNIMAGTITTVTNLTNLPTMPADWITASGLKTDAVAEIADGVLDEAMAGHVGAGTLGKAIADTLEDTGNTIPADLVDIENKIDVIATDTTTEIPASITALNGKIDTIDNYIDTEVAAIKAKTDNLPASPAAVGSAMTLTSGERTAIANEVEAQIINEADAERVLTAITDKIASVNPSLDDLTLAGIASAVRTELATELSRIDAAITSRLSSAGYTAPDNASISAIKAKTDNLPASPADQSELEVLIAALPPAPSASDIIATLKVAVFDGTLTFEDSIKLYNAMLFGKLDGGGSGTLKFRDPADTKDRVTATVDISTGDRDDITLDLT